MTGEMFVLCAVFVQSLYGDPHMSRSYEAQLIMSFSDRTEVCISVAEAAERGGHDWELMVSLAFEESRFEKGARSSAGAIGPMQVLPRYFCPNGVEKDCDLVGAGLNAWTAWLNKVDKRRPDRVARALCHYNSGTTCSRGGERYARRVLGRLARMRPRAMYLRQQAIKAHKAWCLDRYTAEIMLRTMSEGLNHGCVEITELQR